MKNGAPTWGPTGILGLLWCPLQNATDDPNILKCGYTDGLHRRPVFILSGWANLSACHHTARYLWDTRREVMDGEVINSWCVRITSKDSASVLFAHWWSLDGPTGSGSAPARFLSALRHLSLDDMLQRRWMSEILIAYCLIRFTVTVRLGLNQGSTT